MWPSEGAFSEEAIQVIATEKVKWVGCDQDVLAASYEGKSLPAGLHFQPYRWGGEWAPAIFFRDKGLSDRIGFVYSAWEPGRAVKDLLKHLQRVHSDMPPGRFLVPIILDGENPWESYPDGGTQFLRELYHGVQNTEGLAWTTFGDFLAEGTGTVQPLEKLCAGSWIRNDLSTWIGHSEKNAGWDYLGRVREWLQEKLIEAGATRTVILPGSAEEVVAPDPEKIGLAGEEPLARAWRAMVAAEGSDWFWWYGEDHPTEFSEEFDALFRAHLANVYRHLGADPDPVLFLSLLTKRPGIAVQSPRMPLQVTLDGRQTSYFEWLDAGRCETGGGSAMHRTAVPVRGLYYGADPDHLFLRLDPEPEQALAPLAGLSLVVHRVASDSPAPRLVFPDSVDQPGPLRFAPELEEAGDPPCRGFFGQIVEVAVPWQRLALKPGEVCDFFVTLQRGEQIELVIPSAGCLTLRIPFSLTDSDEWLV
jgi:hypothetical protein